MSRRDPGDRYAEALEADRRRRQDVRDAAEDRYTRELAVVRVLSLMPPLLFCFAMIAGAFAPGVATVFFRFLGPLTLVACLLLAGLAARYRNAPERDRDLDTVLLSGAVFNGLLALTSDHVLYVLPPLGVLMAPMVLRRIPRVHPDSAKRGERGT
ncbi:hypothetical protein ACFXIY_09185 [Streptomyces albidoflavus]